MKILRRIWTGIVGGVAGVALAVLILVVGLMSKSLEIDSLKWILVACAITGFLLGIVIGPRGTKPTPKD